MDAIIQAVFSLVNADNVWNILSLVGVASVIQAYVSSKSNSKNPWIKQIDQLIRDLLNIVAFNINKASNKDDDR